MLALRILKAGREIFTESRPVLLCCLNHQLDPQGIGQCRIGLTCSNRTIVHAVCFSMKLDSQVLCSSICTVPIASTASAFLNDMTWHSLPLLHRALSGRFVTSNQLHLRRCFHTHLTYIVYKMESELCPPWAPFFG